MRFAFLIIGNFNYKIDKAILHGGKARIVGVANIEEACIAAKELKEEGIGCIELCGAFGEAGAKAIIKATENKLPVGYITHLPEQDSIYHTAFSQQ